MRTGTQVLVTAAGRFGPALSLVFATALLAASCGGQSTVVPGDDDDGGTGGTGGSRGGGAGRGGSGGTGGGSAATGGTAGTDQPIDEPGCPDASAPEGFVECDVFGVGADCPVGFGCYPYITHPFGEGCDQQSFGALCAPAGSGTQGAFCDGGANICAPGFLCVVGAQPGKRCMRMCPLDGSAECAPGLICGKTDALGVGVCS
jgi:hypothetical protein